MRKLYLDTNLQIVFGITLMVVMSVSSIIPVLPQLIRVFGLTPQAIGLVITWFTLPGVLLTPFFGILADRIGRKRILIPSLILFGLSGPACALAETWNWLLFFRFLQGTGAAALGMINMTLIGDLYSGRERTAAMGYNAGVLSVGTALFPALGGVLASAGWRFPFLLPLLALPLAMVVLYRLDNPEPDFKQSLQQYFAQALGQMINRRVFGLLLATLAIFILLYGPFVTYLPILLDRTFRGSPTSIGLIISAASLSTAVVASQLGRIVRYISEYRLISLAFLCYTVSFLLIPQIGDMNLMLVPVLVFGLGQAFGIPNVVSLLTGLVDARNRASMMAVNSTLLRLGQTLGPILMGSLFAAGGLDLVFLSAVILSLAVFLSSILLLTPPE